MSDPGYATRGELTEQQIALMDQILVGHGLEPSSPHRNPEFLAYVCLNCGSIGVNENEAARDHFVKTFDFLCCGTTVYFHSTHRVLVDPANIDWDSVKVTVVGERP